MRELLIVSMLVSGGAVLALMLGLHAQLRRFQKRFPELRTSDDLQAFKALASAQMYASLVGLILVWVPLLIWIFGKFVFGRVGWIDLLLYVVIPFVVQLVTSGFLVGTARAIRATPARDMTLETERDRIVDVWLHRSLPNW